MVTRVAARANALLPHAQAVTPPRGAGALEAAVDLFDQKNLNDDRINKMFENRAFTFIPPLLIYNFIFMRRHLKILTL